MKKKAETRVERSAGGVVYRRHGRGAQVVLIATEDGGRVRWGLPKGHIHKSESVAEAAVREVNEETGLRVEIEAPLKVIEYWFFWKRSGVSVRHHKQVEFFLMRPLGGDLAGHDDEVLEARWFGLKAAQTQITFDTEREVLREVERRIRP